jgi:hypothetical protein
MPIRPDSRYSTTIGRVASATSTQPKLGAQCLPASQHRKNPPSPRMNGGAWGIFWSPASRHS